MPKKASVSVRCLSDQEHRSCQYAKRTPAFALCGGTNWGSNRSPTLLTDIPHRAPSAVILAHRTRPILVPLLEPSTFFCLGQGKPWYPFSVMSHSLWSSPERPYADTFPPRRARQSGMLRFGR